jgi:hypothetical protein
MTTTTDGRGNISTERLGEGQKAIIFDACTLQRSLSWAAHVHAAKKNTAGG